MLKVLNLFPSGELFVHLKKAPREFYFFFTLFCTLVYHSTPKPEGSKCSFASDLAAFRIHLALGHMFVSLIPWGLRQ